MLQRLWQLKGIHWGLATGLLASLCCIGPPVAVLLGVSGASFLVGLTLFSPYFYALSILVLIVGYIYIRRRMARTCPAAEQRRSRWIFPATMAGVMAGTYLVFTEVLTPVLTPLASQRLSPDARFALDMPGMAGSPNTVSMGSTAEVPVMLISGTRAAPAGMVGSIRRAELIIDKMT